MSCFQLSGKGRSDRSVWWAGPIIPAGLVRSCRSKIKHGQKTGSGALYLKRREIFKANILDNFKSLIFCFHTFGVRRTIDVLDSENQLGSDPVFGPDSDPGLTWDV